jgi:outer membrane immunogenic protein
MRKLTTLLAAAAALISAPSLAADLRMPVKAPAAVVAEAFNWSGFYIGAHVGGGWGRKRWLFDAGTVTSHDVDGIFAGGQVGFNWQAGNWVFGIEGEGSWADLDGQSVCPNPAANCRTEVDWLASLTGRLGYAWGPSLLYVKGGAAWAGDHYFVRFPATPIFDERSGEQTHSGWTIGGGFEYGFSPNWSAKIEYMYADLGRRGFDFTRINTGAFVESARVRQEIHTVKFGINYRFNWASPVVASY